MSSPGHVILFSPQTHSHTLLIPYLAAMHASCITHDSLSATFMPPLSHEKLLSWWKDRIAEINQGTRLMWILVRDDSHPAPENDQVTGPDVVGVASLAMPFSETGHFRANVEKLFIHTDWRRRGGALKLLEVLEAEAKDRGKTLLTLNTETDSAADYLYKKAGYVELGKVPDYGLNPTGVLRSGTFYWKKL